MRKKNYRPSDYLLSFVYMLFFISVSVVLILNFRPLYYHDIRSLNLEEVSGMSEEEIRDNYDTLISYNSMFNRDELEFPTLPMSKSGQIHFVEVKRIFVFVQYLAILTFLAAAFGTIWKIRKKQTRYLKLAGILTLVVPAICGILIALNWEQAFITFHHIFFRNDYWLFDPATDPIIVILPDAFFLHCAVGILLLVLFFSIISIMAAHILRRH